MLISTAWSGVFLVILASLAAFAYGVRDQRRIEADAARRSFAGLGESLLKLHEELRADEADEQSPRLEVSPRDIPARPGGPEVRQPRPRFDIEKALVLDPRLDPGVFSTGILRKVAPLKWGRYAVAASAALQQDRHGLPPETRGFAEEGRGTFGILDEEGHLHPLEGSERVVICRIVDDPSDNSSS